MPRRVESGVNNEMAKTIEELQIQISAKTTGLQNELTLIVNKLKTTEEAAKKTTSGFSLLAKGFKGLSKHVSIGDLAAKAVGKMADYTWENLKVNAQFASSFNDIKTNMMTAFQPVYDAILPAINALMNGFARASAYIAVFVSSMFGKTYKQSFEASKGLEKARKGMSGYGAAAQKAKGELAGFDQLNTLHIPEASAGDSGGTSDFEMTMPDMDVDGMQSKVDGLTEGIKSSFGSAGEHIRSLWNELGGSIWTSIETGLASNGESIRGNLTTNLQSIFSGALQVGSFFGNLSEIVGMAVEESKPAIVDAFTGMATAAYSVFDTTAYILTDSFEQVWTFLNTWVEEHKDPLVDALSGYWTNAAATTGLFSTIVEETFNSLKGFWERWGEDILGIILKPLGLLGDMVLESWNNLVQPVWERLLQWLTKIWDESLSGLVDEVLGFVGRVAELFGIIWEKVEPILQACWKNIIEAARTNINFLMDILGPIVQFIVDIAKDIMLSLNGVLEFLLGAFTGDWTRAWNGIKQVFEGIWNGIRDTFKMVFNVSLGIVEGFINSAISVINTFIRSINLAIGAVNKIPGVNIDKLEVIPDVKIPKLAVGTNYVAKDGLAFLHEGEAVVPKKYNPDAGGNAAGNQQMLSALNAILQAVQSHKGQVVVRVGETEIASVVIDGINRLQRQAGRTLLEV